MRADLKRLKRETDSSRATPKSGSDASAFASSSPTQSASPISGATPALGSVMAHSSQSSSSVVLAAKRHKFGVVGGALATVAILSAAGFGVYSLLHHATASPFQNFSISQVTNSSKAVVTAISSDGKYLLTVMDDKGLNSVWLRNIVTASDTQIVPPSATIPNVAFFPDGNYVYFRKAENAINSDFNIYRTPILGGTPQVVAQDVDSAVAFSPDGGRMAYFRGNDPETGKYRLLSAKLDGSDEKVLHIEPLVYLPRWLAWSPDGKKIAYPDIQRGAFGGISFFDVDTGKIQTINFSDKNVSALQWSPGGDGLFVTYQQKGPDFNRGQVGFVSLSDGRVRPISRDTNSYSTLTLSADGKTVATVQQKALSNLFVLPGEGSMTPTASPLVVDGEHISQFNWTSDGDLLTSDRTRMVRTDVYGKNPTVLVSDPAAGIVGLSPCGTQSIVFPWGFRGGTNSIGIWRVNADGSHPTQLTDGSFDRFPVCAGNWAYFFRDVTNIWRVSLNGTVDGSDKAEPVPASAVKGAFQAGRGMGISPDGRLLAYLVEFVNPEAGSGTARIALLDLTTRTTPRILEVNQQISAGPQFTIDGKALAYPVRENGVDNVWIQPLDGSAGRQITKFDSEQILSFHWSPDGKNLGVLRGHTDSDVVLLKESKP